MPDSVPTVPPDGAVPSDPAPAVPPDGAVPPHASGARPAFAHASEAELARILDFYAVAWEYEPHTFPILWNLEGEVLESFAPDFYLPELDLYIELTTLKQKLVRKKNRKLRRLRELYPGVRIKLFYGRDFRMLMLKFGRLALHDGLAGTMGQSTPPRESGAKGDAAITPGVPATEDGAEERAADGELPARPPRIAAAAGTVTGVPGGRGTDTVEHARMAIPGHAGRARGRRRRRRGAAPAANPGPG
jgi:hypothetical protein